jgi:hypothetical protein
MKTEEYERLRRALSQQLAADLDLIRAGHAAKLRALEELWLTSPEEGAAGARSLAQAPTRAPLSETVSSETPDPARARASRRGDTLNDLRTALPHLPEIFEREDIYRVLGYTPARATLYRALWILKSENLIGMARLSDGGIRSQYRNLTEP